MLQAHVIIELLPDDASAEKLLHSLDREFKSLGRCKVVRKKQFPIEEDFDQGALQAIKGAVETDQPWGVYIAPRRLDIVLNGAFAFPINGTFVAVARRRQAVALFLHTFTRLDIPDEIAQAISGKIDAVRRRLMQTALTGRDEQVVEGIGTSVKNAYVQAFGPMFNQ